MHMPPSTPRRATIQHGVAWSGWKPYHGLLADLAASMPEAYGAVDTTSQLNSSSRARWTSLAAPSAAPQGGRSTPLHLPTSTGRSTASTPASCSVPPKRCSCPTTHRPRTPHSGSSTFTPSAGNVSSLLQFQFNGTGIELLVSSGASYKDPEPGQLRVELRTPSTPPEMAAVEVSYSPANAMWTAKERHDEARAEPMGRDRQHATGCQSPGGEVDVPVQRPA